MIVRIFLLHVLLKTSLCVLTALVVRRDAPNADIIEGINWIITQELAQTDGRTAVLSMSLGMPSQGFYAGEQVCFSGVGFVSSFSCTTFHVLP